MELPPIESAVADLKEKIIEYDLYLGRRILDLFPTLSPILRQIRDLVATIDLNHLSQIPVQTLHDLKGIIEQATACIKDYMVNSFPAEEQVPKGGGVVRPEVQVRNPANINSWRGQMAGQHQNLFHLIGPILTQQQRRVAQISSGVHISIDVTESIAAHSTNDDVLWRYMPVRNLIRSAVAGGIWMVSLSQLRKWSERGIADIREGEIPPVVARFKTDFEEAVTAGDERLRLFAENNKLDRKQVESLPRIFSGLAMEPTTTFVSSWVNKPTERTHMWSHYGNDGRGVAVRTTLRKLLNHPWRLPFEVAGLTGSARVSKLILQAVHYLQYIESEKLPSIDKLHLPILKPDAFEDEHEVRLIAFTQDITLPGFTLLGNLHDLIEEIVVGPHAALETVTAEIEFYAPDLVNVPIRRSTLPPGS